MGRGGRIGQKIGGAGKGGCERLGTEKDRDGLGGGAVWGVENEK